MRISHCLVGILYWRACRIVCCILENLAHQREDGTDGDVGECSDRYVGTPIRTERYDLDRATYDDMTAVHWFCEMECLSKCNFVYP